MSLKMLCQFRVVSEKFDIVLFQEWAEIILLEWAHQLLTGILIENIQKHRQCTLVIMQNNEEI